MGRWKSVSEWHAREQASYNSAKRSRLRRDRIVPSSGAPGDFHLLGNDYLRIMEYARAIDRDDSVLPSILDRAEINTTQSGFGLDFDTGDLTLDQDLMGGWCEHTENPELIDASGELCFDEMLSMAFRQSMVDGDIWALLTDSGVIQWFEADRVRTPYGLDTRNIAHGVEMNDNRKQIAIWLTAAIVGTLATMYNPSEMYKVPVRDDDGLRRMLQIKMGVQRTTLTRGISIYQRLFDLSGMHDDTQFAAILKQQLQNALVFTEKMESGDIAPQTEFGPKEEGEVVSAGTATTVENLEGLGPATVVRSTNGRTLEPSRNTAPGPEFVNHIKMILTLMGINCGMPLVLVLMDAKETNFSGWRGAFDQAKMGFRRNQNRLVSKLADPVLTWHLKLRGEKDARIKAAMDRIVRAAQTAGKQWYKWHLPSFPYVNPMEDSQASLIAVANYQEAPSTNMAKQGLDHDREMTRGIEDRLFAMNRAAVAAESFNKAHPDAKPVASWQDFYTPLQPKHVTMSISEPRIVDEPPPPAAGPKPNGA